MTFKSINISTHIKSSDELPEEHGRRCTKCIRIPEQFKQAKRDDRQTQGKSQGFPSLKG